MDRSVDDERLAHVFELIEPVLAASLGLAGVIERDHTGSPDSVRMRRLAWLRDRVRPLGVPLWVNRRVDLALAIEADGVQLTSRSPSTADIRRSFPKISVARSCHSHAEAAVACLEGADFILLSPVFAPISKAPELGPLGLVALVAATRALNRPVIALGGMSLDRLEAVSRAGAAGVATIGGVFNSDDPRATVAAYVAYLRSD